ncbi:MAG: hypothetical protein FJ304_20160 [Planctomycetes bacterium]|nr:hypothetical protein [Planctomycetota bacterium]
MRRYLLLVLALGALAPVGCGRFAGPLESRQQGRVDPKDREGRPVYNLDEQQKRGRERLSISEDDFRIGPKGYIDRPSPIGR